MSVTTGACLRKGTIMSRDVSVVAIATGRYAAFVPALVAGVQRHIVGLDRIFVLADHPLETNGPVCWLPWGHVGWPFPTLLRYRAMTAYRDLLSNTDVLLYTDVDMRFVRDIDLREVTGTLAVHHPGYGNLPPDQLPYERRPESRCSIPIGEGKHYFAGGIQGGESAAYLSACEIMAAWLQDDLSRGVIPVWHDESAWNKYCSVQPPTQELPREYCQPEYEASDNAFIIALDKNHDQLREVPWQHRLKRQLRGAKRRLLRMAVPIVRLLRGSG